MNEIRGDSWVLVKQLLSKHILSSVSKSDRLPRNRKRPLGAEVTGENDGGDGLGLRFVSGLLG